MNHLVLSHAIVLEQERCATFVSGDPERIAKLLDPELCYIHSNGSVDTRETLVHMLASGAVRYAAITPDVHHAVAIGDSGIVLSGILETHAILSDLPKALLGRYTAAWRRSGHAWRLVALQGSVTVGAPHT